MAFDISIEHSNEKVGYRLAKDPETQDLIYRPGLAPELSPQVRQDNYSYGHIPPQVAVIVAFEQWHKGAGFPDSSGDEFNEFGADRDPDSGGIATHRYNYSRGVDTSFSGKLYLSPAMQALLESDASAIGAAPDYYSRTSDGVFMVAGRYIYEFNGTGWVLRYDHGVGDAHTGPVVDFNGVQFCPAGDSDPYVYSSDGATWADVTTISDTNAYKFVVRGQSSGNAVLWKISSTGALKSNTSGESGGGQWSAATQMGGAGSTVGGIVIVDGDFIVTKTDGIHTFDGTTASTVWDGGQLMYRSNNGSNPFVWRNNKVYTTYGNVLVEYDHIVDNKISFVWPRMDGVGNDELNGEITAISGDNLNLYFALKNAAGNTYIMKGTPEEGFHTLAYLGSNNCDALLVAGAGDIHANNPTLLIGYGTAGNYFILPRTGLRPEDDSNYKFETSGYIVGPWIQVGARGFTKFLNSGFVFGRSLATGKSATLKYDIGDGFVELLLADETGKSEANVVDEVEFNHARYRLDLASPASTVSPVVESIVFSTTLNNPRKRMWDLVVDISSEIMPVGGGDPKSSLSHMESHLFKAKNKRVFFYDIYGVKHRARVIDITGAGAKRDSRSVNQKLNVTLVEV